MITAINKLQLVLNDSSDCFFLILLSMLGVMVLCYTIAATMAQTSRQQDDLEQLALKFSHKK